MTAPQFLEHARRIDADIMALDRRYAIAQVNHAPQKTLLRMVTQRNALVQAWSEAWQTRKVEP